MRAPAVSEWKFNFKQVDRSEALEQYTQERLEPMETFLLKDSVWQIYYSMGRYDYRVEIIVLNPDGKFKATANSDESLYSAVDEAALKLSRQFVKFKEKMQAHKKFERSKKGRLQRLNPALEYDNNPFPSSHPSKRTA
jgi:ribosomal subunit interface protein